MKLIKLFKNHFKAGAFAQQTVDSIGTIEVGDAEKIVSYVENFISQNDLDFDAKKKITSIVYSTVYTKMKNQLNGASGNTIRETFKLEHSVHNKLLTAYVCR